MTLDKTYRPDEVEPRQYAAWERSGGFACDPKSAKRPYTIMMPPPNVTGSLHMGHALTFTLQDILIRFERMRGRDALWQPGTDHAGIATEIVVTNQLAERQINKHDLGREKFIERVWGVEGEIRRHDRQPAAPARLLLAGLAARAALPMDPGPRRGGAQGVRPALSRGPDLPRQAAGQLGSGDAHHHLRPRS